MKRQGFAALLLALALAAPGAAKAELAVIEAWARPSVGASDMAAVYLALDNLGDRPLRLVAVETPAAGRVELHATISEEGRLGMRRLDRAEVAPAARLAFCPGGVHLMLLDLAQPLVADEVHALVLEFAEDQRLETEFEIRSDTPAESPCAR